jgi:hypothetical protein
MLSTCGTNGFIPPGGTEIDASCHVFDEPTHSGVFLADSNGTAMFQFKRKSKQMHLSGIAIGENMGGCSTIEHISSLAENNFNDRGDSTLDVLTEYTYQISNGYNATLRGWTHTSTYAKGFAMKDGYEAAPFNPQVNVTGLVPGRSYEYRIYQFDSSGGGHAKLCGTNGFLPPGGSEIDTTCHSSDDPTHSGVFHADSNGEALFKFVKKAVNVHLSGIAIGHRVCEGTTVTYKCQ